MCGHDRGNGAPVPEGAIGASMHPLGVHKYAGGVQSCANRLLLKLVRAACGPDRDRAWQFRHALSTPETFVARLRSSPSGSRAWHRRLAAHYIVAARSAPLRVPSPCPACASPRRTRTAVRLIASLTSQVSGALIANTAPRRKLALSSPAHIPASRHIVQPFSVAGLILCGGDTPLVK
jgi:hypothetical protein